MYPIFTPHTTDRALYGPIHSEPLPKVPSLTAQGPQRMATTMFDELIAMTPRLPTTATDENRVKNQQRRLRLISSSSDVP